MKKIITIALIISISTCSFAQVLNNSSDGESSTVYPKGAISFDLNTATLGFSYLYYGDSSAYNSGFFGGINILAKNNENIANLFNRGDCTPEGKGKAVFGHAWVLGESRLGENLYSISNYLRKADSLYISKLKNDIDSILKDGIVDGNKYLNAKTVIVDKIDKIPFSKFNKIIEQLSLKDSTISELLLIVSDYISDTRQKHLKMVSENETTAKSLSDEIANANRWRYRLSVYLEGGVNALEFKHYNFMDSLNFSKNFKPKDFKGGDIKLGINCQIGGTFIFGVAGGYKSANNFQLLSSKDYVLRNSISNSTQQQITEKKVTAYSGDFIIFNQKYFLLDLVYFKKIDSKNIVAINPYFKTRISSNIIVYPNVSDIGLNSFFFKPNGKFSGGIYIELSDINDNLEKMKAEPDLRKPENRLNFGIVAKFNIGSFPNYSN